MTGSMRDFCFLSLNFVIIINNILLTHETTTPDIISLNYVTSAIAYAQQQQEQPPSRNQEWIDRQSNTKLLFRHSPETPLVAASTDLIFDIQDLKTDAHFKDVLARVTITDVQQQQQIPLKLYNVTAADGHFSIKYRFAHEGTYQIIVKLDSNYSALTLASFKIVVPFQPLGVINMSHILPLLIPAGLVAVVGTVAILVFMIAVNRKRK